MVGYEWKQQSIWRMYRGNTKCKGKECEQMISVARNLEQRLNAQIQRAHPF